MMPTADLIAGIEAHCSQAIERALPVDVLGKLLILRLPEHETAWGLASGSGAVAAMAHGGGALDRAVSLNTTAIVDFYDSLDEARCAALAIACHEAAHLLTARPDPLVTHDEATAIWSEILTVPSIGGACWHPPRWAGSFFVAVDRLRGVLPLAEHRSVVRHAWSGLQGCGFQPLAILDALDGRELPESVAAAFAPDTAASLALMGACDSESAREAWINRTYQHTFATPANAAR